MASEHAESCGFRWVQLPSARFQIPPSPPHAVSAPVARTPFRQGLVHAIGEDEERVRFPLFLRASDRCGPGEKAAHVVGTQPGRDASECVKKCRAAVASDLSRKTRHPVGFIPELQTKQGFEYQDGGFVFYEDIVDGHHRTLGPASDMHSGRLRRRIRSLGSRRGVRGGS